jgi:hypothetical protein
MQFSTKTLSVDKLKTACAIVPVLGDQRLTGDAQALDAACGGRLSTLLRRALHGYYRSPAAARADVELLRANAAAFNPDGHPIRAAADGLARALAAALRDDGDEAVAPLPAPSVAADAGAGADAHADAADGGGGGGGGEAHAIDE